MSVEEISHGSDRRPPRERGPVAPRTRRIAVGVLLVLVVGAGAFALRGEAQRRAAADAARAPKPHPSRTDFPGGVVTVGVVCPAVTDHRTSLDLAFTLVPEGPLVVRRILPLLPMGGLVFEGYEVRTGGCSVPGTAVGEPPFPTSTPVLVTFHFRLPTTCPAPYPVGVSAAVQVGDDPALTREIVFRPDLGGIPFDTCVTS